MSTMSDYGHVSPCDQLWWASSWKWTRSMPSFITFYHPYICTFIHPLPSSHFSLGTLRLQIVDSSRCTHIDVQSHHSNPSSQKRNELIRHTYLHKIHESSFWKKNLPVLERASKETKKGDRIGHSQIGSRQADGFLLLLFDDTRVVGWCGGSVAVCGGERAGAIRHSWTLRRVRVQWARGERAGSCGVGGFHRPPVHRLQDRVAGGEEGVGALRQLPRHHCAPFPCPVRSPACFVLFPPTCSALLCFLLVVGCNLKISTNVAI